MYEPNKRKWNVNESWIGFSRIFGMQDFVGHNLYMEWMGRWKWWNVRCVLLVSRAKIVKHSKLKKCSVTRFIFVVGQLFMCVLEMHMKEMRSCLQFDIAIVSMWNPMVRSFSSTLGYSIQMNLTSQIMHVLTSKNAWDLEKFKDIDKAIFINLATF
jgi:hypothetical protein